MSKVALRWMRCAGLIKTVSTKTVLTRSVLARTFLATVVGLFLGVSSQVSAADDLVGFAPTGDYTLQLEGEPTALTEVFLSEAEVCWLVLARELPAPLLIDLKTSQARWVSPASLERLGDGVRLTNATAGIDWASAGEANRWSPGEVTRRRGEIRFHLGDQALALVPKPAQVGPQDSGAVRRRHPAMALQQRRRVALKSADPEVTALQGLALGDDRVRVRVYYGSWCRSCDRLLGNVLALEERLAGSSIDFEYYGLPKPFDDDAVARREGVQGVPVADVFVGEDRLGRLESLELLQPASALHRLLVSTAP